MLDMLVSESASGSFSWTIEASNVLAARIENNTIVPTFGTDHGNILKGSFPLCRKIYGGGRHSIESFLRWKSLQLFSCIRLLTRVGVVRTLGRTFVKNGIVSRVAVDPEPWITVRSYAARVVEKAQK